MKTYQVTQKNEWCCPNMLIFVEDGLIVGQQDNAENSLTQHWAIDGEDWGIFNPDDYAKVAEI